MMSLDWISIARPYAKAVFELALSKSDSKQLKIWSEKLNVLAIIASQPEAILFIKRPEVTPEKATNTFIEVAEEKDPEAKNFIQLLAKTGRLGALPAIYRLYENLRADYEKTIEASVVSFEKLTTVQQDELASALKKRLKREVHLTVEVDKSLLGGAIVHAGDLVVDGSIRGKLHRLNEEMMK
jgi:F-type H+-transporting ATPase subunit delta